MYRVERFRALVDLVIRGYTVEEAITLMEQLWKAAGYDPRAV